MPFHVQTDALRVAAAAVADAGENAESRLSASRVEAASSGAGFPGDAAAPFATMLNALDAQDDALVAAVRGAHVRVGEAACGYDDQEGQNVSFLERLRPGR